MKHIFTIILLLVLKSVFCQNSSIILQDNFKNNNNNWLISADQTSVLRLDDEGYFIQNKLQYNSITSRIEKPFDESKDFVITCEMKKIKGFNKKGYGLIWGRNKADYYGFYITGEGEFLVLKWETGQRDFIIGIQPSKHIKKDNATNKLSVVKEGNKQKYYINDSLVAVTDFLPFYGYEVGFANGGKLSMIIHSLTIKYLETETLKKEITNNIIIDESFANNKNNWPTGKLKGGFAEINNGKYSIENKSKNPVYAKIPVKIDFDKNVTLSASITEYPENKDDSYCVLWGSDLESNQYYAFRINTFYGSYEYYRIINGEIDKLIGMTFSSVINTQKEATNKVLIEKTDKTYVFYINDKKVNSFRYQPTFGNDVGFITHFKHKILVEDLLIRYSTPSF